MEAQLTTLQMQQAWYAYQVDQKAAKENLTAFEVLELDDKLDKTDDPVEFFFHYQAGRGVLCSYQCILSAEKFIGAPPHADDPLLLEEMPDICAGFLPVEAGHIRDRVVYEVIYFVPITPILEHVRRERLLMKLASISDNEALLMHTDAGRISVERLEADRFLLFSWVDYPHAVFRSTIGDLLEIWKIVIELEDRIARQWQIVQRD